jgi:hypothetical protein
MGIICCKYDSKSDAANEIKKPTNLENSLTLYNSKNLTDSSNAEQIILRQKENPLKDYSLLLFQELNTFREEPHKYYLESIQYNLTNIVKELIKNKNKEKNKKDLKLKWSSKIEIIIYDIMQNKSNNDIIIKLKEIKKKFEKIYDLLILYVIGNSENIKESLWDFLNNFKKSNEKKFNEIMTNKIDYCVIYSIQCEDIILQKLYHRANELDPEFYKINNDNNDNKEMNDNYKEKIISFYFLFICLEDGIKTSSLENSDVVYW